MKKRTINIDAKPLSITIKDYLIKKVAVKNLQSEEVVERIISSQFRHLMQAFHECNTIELSGLCKFYVSRPRLKLAIKSYGKLRDLTQASLDVETDPKQYEKSLVKVNQLTETVKILELREAKFASNDKD